MLDDRTAEGSTGAGVVSKREAFTRSLIERL